MNCLIPVYVSSSGRFDTLVRIQRYRGPKGRKSVLQCRCTVHCTIASHI